MRRGMQDGPTLPIVWPALVLALALPVYAGIEDGPDPVGLDADAEVTAIIDDGVTAVATVTEVCQEDGDCVIVPEVACDGIVDCATSALLNCTGNGGANAAWLAEDILSTHNGNACKFRCNDGTVKRVRCLKVKRPAPMPPDVGR